jgi:hypothetical protein
MSVTIGKDHIRSAPSGQPSYQQRSHYPTHWEGCWEYLCKTKRYSVQSSNSQDTEHALLTVTRRATVEPDGVSGVDYLGNYRTPVLVFDVASNQTPHLHWKDWF